MAGRGKTSSLTQEQLQTLGVGKDLPVQTAPPPTYPPLISKPVAQETTAAQNYQILWKEDFLNHMRDSPYFLTPKTTSTLTRLTEQWMESVDSSKAKAKPEFNWAFMPAELNVPSRKRRAAGQRSKTKKPNEEKKAKSANIEDHLKLLEEKERNDDVREKANSDSDKDDDEEEEEIVAADEEMDDENDYGNSYFDNGEAYNEEDDNLDDGPVY